MSQQLRVGDIAHPCGHYGTFQIVSFSADGNLTKLRILSVLPRQFEIIVPTSTAIWIGAFVGALSSFPTSVPDTGGGLE